MKIEKLIFISIALMMLGVSLIIIEALLVGLSKGRVGVGGVVLIGPFPLVFGLGEEAGTLMIIAELLAIALIILTVLVWLVLRRE